MDISQFINLLLLLVGASGVLLCYSAVRMTSYVHRHLYSLEVSTVYRQRLKALKAGVVLLCLCGAAGTFFIQKQYRDLAQLQSQNREFSLRLAATNLELADLCDLQPKNVVDETEEGTKPLAAVVIADSLAVRLEPKGRQIGRLIRNQLVQVIRAANPGDEWTEIVLPDQTRGWVAQRYLRAGDI